MIELHGRALTNPSAAYHVVETPQNPLPHVPTYPHEVWLELHSETGGQATILKYATPSDLRCMSELLAQAADDLELADSEGLDHLLDLYGEQDDAQPFSTEGWTLDLTERIN